MRREFDATDPLLRSSDLTYLTEHAYVTTLPSRKDRALSTEEQTKAGGDKFLRMI